MINLSLCIITKNEAKHLDKCLASCISICDEIILVDSGSSDSTIEIAKKFGAKIYQIDWRDDYSYARNIAIEKASGKWILFLDGDEYLVNGNKILKSLEKAEDVVGGFYIERKDAFYHPENGKICFVPIGITRIIKNHKKIRFEEPVHEFAGRSVLKSGFKLSYIDKAYIHHNIIANSKTFLNQKQKKYLRLIENSVEKDPKNFWQRYHQGKTLWFFSRYQDSLNVFQEVLNDPTCAIEIKKASYRNILAILVRQKEYQQAKDHVDRYTHLFNIESEDFFLHGDLWLYTGQYKKALKSYAKIKTNIHPTNTIGYFPSGFYLYKWQKLFRISLCFYKKAPLVSLFLLNLSLLYNNRYVDALLLKSRIFKNQGKRNKSCQLFQQVKKINPEWEIMYKDL